MFISFQCSAYSCFKSRKTYIPLEAEQTQEHPELAHQIHSVDGLLVDLPFQSFTKAPNTLNHRLRWS